MVSSRSILLALALGQFAPIHALPATAKYFRAMDAKPNLPYDPNTSTYCTWWIDYTGSEACADILSNNWIDIDQFRRWNPSVGADCSGMKPGNSYCVEALFEPPPAPTSTTKASSSSKVTATPTPTPTSSSTKSSAPPTTTTKPPGNGIETPLPTQPNIVSNCDLFYFVQQGDGCQTIADKFGISLAKFLAWNPAAGQSCGGLWAEAYACVSIIGEEGNTKSSTPSPTPTSPGNGIQTPLPTQPNLVSNCDKFHFVKTGDSCQGLATQYGITLNQFLTWNPSAGSTCGGLWAEAYACVSIIGHEPSPTPTTTTPPPGGVQTPTPTQPGMIAGCKKFDFVNKGDTCDVITKRNNITLANFVKWNSGVGSDCRSMWAEAYVCVGV